MTDERRKSLLQLAIKHIDGLVSAPVAPELPPELADNAEMSALHESILTFRGHMLQISCGDLSQDVELRGYLAGLIKKQLANLRHLTWQVRQVSVGDFSQRVDFMGDFSKAFNNMVVQLDTTMNSLRTTEQALTKLTVSLRRQIDLRNSAVKALKQSEARFKYLADHDPLTGALNRRSFLLIAETGVKTASNAGAPCCLALLDVDLFKKFNDTHGHLDGDAALKQVVHLSQQNLRQSDSMGRYGGEEFIFFFADADIDQGKRAAERIRKAIADNPVFLASGPVKITASIGVCSLLPEWGGLDRDPSFVQRAISMADAAMYKAKQGGRNQVQTAPVAYPDSTSLADFLSQNPRKHALSATGESSAAPVETQD